MHRLRHTFACEKAQPTGPLRKGNGLRNDLHRANKNIIRIWRKTTITITIMHMCMR